jgi:PII-like signaling protein
MSAPHSPNTPKKMLVILVDESDTWGEHPLYEGICRKLIQLDAPGATVLAGIMGYGSQHKIHRKRLFGVSDDRPISITVVAGEDFLRQTIIPAVRPMVTEGLILLMDVEIVD